MQPRGLAHDDRHSISGGPNMHWTRGILTFAAICGLLIGSNAAAHEEDPAGDIAALKEAQQKIETELSEVKGELQALRGELKKVLTELKALKAKQNTPKKQSKRPAEQLLGQPAPQRKVTTTESKEITIGGKQDKPQVLFFYASWCPHCRRAMPGMETLHQGYKDKGVDVIAINIDRRSGRGARTEEQSLDQFKGVPCTMPLILDPDGKTSGPFKVRPVPNTFVLGKDGTVESVHFGAKKDLEKTIAAELDVLLAGKTRADFPGAKKK